MTRLLPILIIALLLNIFVALGGEIGHHGVAGGVGGGGGSGSKIPSGMPTSRTGSGNVTQGHKSDASSYSLSPSFFAIHLLIFASCSLYFACLIYPGK